MPSDAVSDRLNVETPADLPQGGVPARPVELAGATLPDGRTALLREATTDDADTLLSVIHGSFRARPRVGEAPAALADTAATVRAALEVGTGYLVEVGGEPAGCVLVGRAGRTARLGRVSVLPAFRRLGVASFAVGVLIEALALRGDTHATLLARKEFAEIRRWWGRHGFVLAGEEGNCYVMERALPVVVEVPDADAMRALGIRLAPLLRAGDLVVASGDLGAGKTTLAQGLGAGLGVSGPVISPTFVLSRVHPSTVGGPALVHVDAYRLSGFDELEDLDLDASLDTSVTLVEWGTGVAEPLASDRLEVDIRRGLDPGDETRWVFLTPVGARWDRDALAAAVEEEL